MTQEGPPVCADGPWTRVQPPVDQKETRDLMTLTERRIDVAIERAEHRRAALLRFAEDVHDEQGQRKPDYAPVVDLIIPVLAAAAVWHPEELFSDLVDAVGEFRRYVRDEGSYLASRDLPDTPARRESTYERLQSDVDFVLDRLMGDR